MKKLSNEQWGLEVNSFPDHKMWALDMDYVDKLSDHDRAFLGQFNQEYYRNRIKKGDKKALHNTDTLRKDCYNRENAANRDLYAIKEVGFGIIGENTVNDEDGNETSALDMVADPMAGIDIVEMDKRNKKIFARKGRNFNRL